MKSRQTGLTLIRPTIGPATHSGADRDISSFLHYRVPCAICRDALKKESGREKSGEMQEGCKREMRREDCVEDVWISAH